MLPSSTLTTTPRGLTRPTIYTALMRLEDRAKDEMKILIWTTNENIQYIEKLFSKTFNDRRLINPCLKRIFAYEVRTKTSAYIVQVTTTLVYKSINSFYSKRRMLRERVGGIGLLWLTPRGDTYIQSFASFTRDLIQSQFSTRHDLSILHDCSFRLTARAKKLLLLYIFWTPTHFSSDAIHVIPFRCPLFILRHRRISCSSNPH